MKAMDEAARTDPAIRARVDMYRHRTPQEFYDLENDPGSTRNLIDSPEHQELAREYQARLRQWMVETNDHCLAAFDVRSNAQALAAEMERSPRLVKPKKDTKPESSEKPSDEDRAAKRRAKRQAAADKP